MLEISQYVLTNLVEGIIVGKGLSGFWGDGALGSKLELEFRERRQGRRFPCRLMALCRRRGDETPLEVVTISLHGVGVVS